MTGTETDAVLAGTVDFDAIVPIGGEFRANSYTSSDQYEAVVTSLADGGFLVTWVCEGREGIFGQRYMADGSPAGGEFRIDPETPGYLHYRFLEEAIPLSGGGFLVTWTMSRDFTVATDLYGRRYAADGSAEGDPFRINTYTDGSAYFSATAPLPDGGFVATWTSDAQDGSRQGVYGQRYGADGSPAGGEFRVNTHTHESQTGPSVTALADGGFVVTWDSYLQDGSGSGVYGQRYDAAGDPAGGEFRINTYTAGEQSASAVTALPNGGFLVTWISQGQDGSYAGVYGQRYAADGSADGGEFRVNTTTEGYQSGASVAVLSDGSVVVTWNSDAVYGQRYAPDGSPDGGEFLVNDAPLLQGSTSSVKALTGGGFVVVWGSWHIEENNVSGIYGRLYTASGTPEGGAFRIDPSTDGEPWSGAVAALPDGGFAVTWASLGPDGFGYGVYARRFTAHSDPEAIAGGSGDDDLSGGGGPDTLVGGDGDDVLVGGPGADFLIGGDGTDTADYSASDGPVSVDMASGNGRQGHAEGDRLSGIETVVGSAFDDVLKGDAGANRLEGGDGDDVLDGGDGDDVLVGGAGDDVLVGGLGADALIGGDGTDTADYSGFRPDWTSGITVSLATGYAGGTGDTFSSIEDLIGSRGHDRFKGDGGANRLEGRDGDDTLEGLGGDDVLVGGAGGDVLIGNTGIDTADYAASTGRVTVSLMSGNGWSGHAAGDTLDSIENAIGSAFDDSLKGTTGANRLEGGAGNDTLDGQAGNDVLAGGAGADRLIGGAGVDTADYSASTGRVTVSLMSGNGWSGHAAGDTLDGIENAIGSAFDDSLKGTTGANRLDGGNGADTLDGQAGNDVVVGGAGADRLLGGAGIDTADYSASIGRVTVSLMSGNGWYGHASGDTLDSIENLVGSAFDDSLKGSAGANRLDGSDGDDTLDGQGGNDVLVGGPGNDRFVFGNNVGNDTIMDFVAGAGTDDWLDLRANSFLDSFADVMASSSQSGADTLITVGPGQILTLIGVNRTDLHQDDFAF